MDPHAPSQLDLFLYAGWLDNITDLDAPNVQFELSHTTWAIPFWPENHALAEAVLRLFERFPDRCEANGAWFLGNVFFYMFDLDPIVVESFRRKRSAGTAAILMCWCADGHVVVDGQDLRLLLTRLANDRPAPPEARRIAQDYLEPDLGRHPGLTDPNLPPPTEDEIWAWEQRALGPGNGPG